MQDLPDSTLFYKLECDSKIQEKYRIEQLPALLIFEKGTFLGKIEGYYTNDEKQIILENIKSIIK